VDNPRLMQSNDSQTSVSSITLLDLFAGQILSGMISTNNTVTDMSIEYRVKRAYEIANVMLAERERYVSRQA
jgi:hypothetical protein